MIVRSGDVLTMYPAGATIPEMIERLRAPPAPPAVEEREAEDLPERPGLELVAYLLDTDVAIRLRDGDAAVTARVAALDGAVLLWIVTRVELEGGVHREPVHAAVRRARLDAMLAAIPTLAFDDTAADAYGAIVVQAGHSRRKLLERMIAVQALVHRAALVTMNPGDLSDVAGLRVVAW